MTLIGLFSFLLRSGFAQEEILLPSEIHPRPTSEAVQTNLNASPQWQPMKEQHWRCLWNEVTHTPHRAWGPPLSIEGYHTINEENVKAASLSFLTAYEENFSFQTELLSLERITHFNGVWYITFHQTHDGFPVLFSRIELRITDEAKVFLVGSDYFNEIQVSKGNGFSSKELAEMVGFDHSLANDKVMILPIAKEKEVTFMKVIHVDDTVNHQELYIHTQDGEIVRRKNKSCHAFSGIAQGLVQQTLPDDPDTIAAFSNMYYEINGEQFTTGPNGEFDIDIDTTSILKVHMRGPFANVRNAFGGNASIEQTIEPNQDVVIKWDDSNSLRSERNVFYHSNIAHDTLKAIDPEFTGLDFSINIDVNRHPSRCNAFYNLGGTINFDAAGNTCVSTGDMAGVIYHEYAHAIYYFVLRSVGLPGTANQAANEAQADIFSAMIEDSPIFANGFTGPGSSTRNLSRNRSYPLNVDSNSPHQTGLILGGAFWDLRTRTSTTLVNRLAHFAKYGAPSGAEVGVVFRDWFLEVLMADDDDNDLSNGTPHFEDINWAFERHGINIQNIVDNTEADIISFEVAEQIEPATIDLENRSISIELFKDSDLTQITPIFTLSHDAVCSVDGNVQISGITSHDFTNPVTYTVTSEDGNNVKDWVVEINVSDFILNSNSEISPVELFPNPFKHELVISLHQPKEAFHQYKARVIALDGTVLIEKKFSETPLIVNTTELKVGTFLVQVLHQETVISTQKMIKNDH